MDPQRDLLVPYWLRTVRIGLVVTVLVLGALVVPPFLPGSTDYRSWGYFAVLGAAATGGATVALLPWRRLFDAGSGIRFMYAWSAADIVLVSFAVGVTGGGRSDLFLVYGLTTVFFGASYPQLAQAGLLAFTFACYGLVLALTGWHVTSLVLFVRLTTLGILAILVSFLSRELVHQMTSHEEARSNSDRWANLLSAVAVAARQMTLDRDRVVESALDGVLALGFDAASMTALDDEGGSYRVVRSKGALPGSDAAEHSASEGVTGLVLREGRTVVLDEVELFRSPSLPFGRGFRAAVASPVWVEGWLACVLLGGRRSPGGLTPQEVDAFELLAAQAGLAVENVRRYEEELHTVERLEELDRLKSDFLATVSHELRTPVTVIEGIGLTLEQAWHGLDDQTRKEMLAGLGANARSLDTIITTLLDFSRIESGRLEVNFGPLLLDDLLGDTAGRLAGLFGPRRLIVDVQPNLAVNADPVLIDRAVENLLSNAVKHTPEDTTVTLSAFSQGADVVVMVRDDGPGIPPEEVPHLGERFFRGGDVNTRTRGMGLGLALVREMLELHRTELQIETEIGKGSAFSFRLPSAAVPARGATERALGRP